MAIKIYIQKRPSIVVQVGAKVINTGGGAVQSVNGKTGVVVLDASDVNAYPDNNPDGYVNAAGAAASAPVQSVNGNTGAVILTASDVGAPSGSGNSTGTNTGDQDLSGLQPILVSGTNIKTINGDSLLGSGNIVISGNDDLLPFDSTLISITGTTSAVIYKEVSIPADIGNCALRFTCFARSITQISGSNVHRVLLGTTFAGATTISQGALFTTGLAAVSQIQNTIAIVGGASGKLTYPTAVNVPFDFIANKAYAQINVDWTVGQKLYFAVLPANTGNVIEVFGIGVEKV